MDSAGSPSSSTTPSETRKNSKPIMEKRRRARINSSLTELKSLLLDVLKQEGSRHNKMEKADILEMTVRHLRQIQRNQFTAAACADADVLNKYQCGFRECVDEVKRYLHNVDGVDVDIRTRLLNHLANSVSAIGQSVTHAQTSEPATAHVRPLKTINKCEEENKSSTKKTNEQNNNNNNLQKSTQLVHNLNVPTSSNSLSSGINLVPQKFSRGEVAVVIPSNLLPGGNVPGYVIPIYASTQINSAQLGFSSVPVGLATATALLPSSEALLPNAPAYRFGTASSSIDCDESSLILLSEKQSSPNQTSSNEHHRNSNKDCDSFNDQKEKGNHQVNPPEMNQNINVQNEEMWRPW